MINKTKLLAAFLGLSLLVGGAGAGCGDDSSDKKDRWAATNNTNVKIDWDKVNEAYKQADGPEDLEKKINEIYEGDEIISVSVQDLDDKNQQVVGFFDKDKDGKASESEKIFTIKRKLEGDKASYSTSGHGPHYGYYASPTYGLATGMLMGAMMTSMFMPSYAPMYRTAYTTSPSRAASISSSRTSYRAANPSRFSKSSQSGRSYGGSTGRSSGGSTSRGGGSYGVRGGKRVAFLTV